MDTFKFVAVNVTEIIQQSNTCQMQFAAVKIVEWTYLNLTNSSMKKTKEMLFGPI
jgi:hypothetical protein